MTGLNGPPAAQQASYTADLQRQEEAYYASFWASDRWGKTAPNRDERARAEAITALIRGHVVPAVAGVARPLRLLDVGCGRGWLTEVLSQFGRAAGVDPVAAAVERAGDLFPHLEFRHGYTDDLIAAGTVGEFDVVVSSEVIEHVPDEAKGAFLGSLRALLRPGGFCLLTTPRGDLFDWWATLGHPRQPVEAWVTEGDLLAGCEAAGLRVVARRRIWIPNHRYNIGARLVSSSYYTALDAAAPRYFRPLRERFGLYQAVLARRA